MPTYQYQCNKCGYQFELRQNFDAPTEMKCPCGGKAERKLSVFSNVHRWTLSEKSYEKYQPMELVKDI